jgi:hypothetical protein
LKCWRNCLSGHLAAISGLITVTYVPVSMVTRHGLLPTQPSVTRLGSVYSSMTVKHDRGSLMYTPASALSPLALAAFPIVGH